MIALIALLLLSCEKEQIEEEAPKPDFSQSTGDAVIRLEEGMLYLDGQELVPLRKPGVLRGSRHRRLMKALRERAGMDPESNDDIEAPLLASDMPALVEVSPQTPFSDLFPVLASAAWVGYGPFELGLVGGEALGPLGMDARQPAAWTDESVLGVAPVLDIAVSAREVQGQLRFDLRVQGAAAADDAPRDPLADVRLLQQHLRLLGTQPLADCATLYEQDAELAAICQEGQRDPERRFQEGEGQDWPPGVEEGQRALRVGGPTGCLASVANAPDERASWPAELADSLRALGADEGFRIILAPDPETRTDELVGLLGAFAAAELPLPQLSLAKPKQKDELGCDAKIRDAGEVRRAAARWLGEQRRMGR